MNDRIADIVNKLTLRSVASKDLFLTIITTRECNLRCRHCNVLDGLCHNETRSLDYAKLERFIAKFDNRKVISFITGGEPLLHPDVFVDTVRVLRKAQVHSVSVGTNLTIMPCETISVLSKLDRVQVSVDGFMDQHDANRGHGTFVKTYRNIRKLILSGSNIETITTMDNHNVSTEYVKQVRCALHYAGVSLDKIHLGLAGPSSCSTTEGVESLKQEASFARLYGEPCCAYRPMRNITVDPDGKLYTNYYDAMIRQGDTIGTIDDNLEDVLKRWIDLILAKAHWIQDENCVKCEALEYCWGMHCVGHMKHPNSPKPSSICDKQARLRRLGKDKTPT